MNVTLKTHSLIAQTHEFLRAGVEQRRQPATGAQSAVGRRSEEAERERIAEHRKTSNNLATSYRATKYDFYTAPP